MLETINSLLAYGALILQVFSVIILLMLILGFRNNILDFIKKHYLVLGFFFSLLPILFSLYYSEIVEFAPCFLCWWQRVFMFPLLFIFGVGIWKRFENSKYYALVLVLVGMLISIYHNYSYYFIGGDGPCDASGVSCNQLLVSELGGYISIPMLSLTGFFAIFVIISVALSYKKKTLSQ